MLDPRDTESPLHLSRDALMHMSTREYSFRAQAAVAESDDVIQGMTEEDVRWGGGCEGVGVLLLGLWL